jgi:hypothetical protein
MKNSLTLLLSESRLVLERDLANADDTRKAVAAANEHVDQIQADYTRELTVHQFQVAASMLQVVRMTLACVEATYADIWEKRTKVSSKVLGSSGRPDGLFAAKIGQLLLAATLIMALISSHSWTGLVLAVFLVGSESLVLIRFGSTEAWFSWLPRGRRAETLAAADVGESTAGRRGVVRVVPRELVNRLEETFAVIEDVVNPALTEPMPTPQAREIEKQFPEIIDLFHELLGARSLNDDAGLRKLVGGRLTQVLRQAGIDVVCYPPPPGRPAERLFELQESNEPDVIPHVLMYPALAREDRVVRKGRVLIPAV